MPEEAVTSTAQDRRQRFRAFAKRFNPTAPAKDLIGQGLICREPRYSIWQKLIRGFDVPASQQLVVGGIGSGKTTELLLAEQEVASTGQMVPLYIDVSAETDLTAVTSGSLLASLGLHAWKELDATSKALPELTQALGTIKRAAEGYDVQVPEADASSALDRLFSQEKRYKTVRVPGKLKPVRSLEADVEELADSLRRLLTALRRGDKEIVVIFDGLDRLIKPDQFWRVAEQDLRALKGQDVSVLIAGPLSVMYGPGRQVADYFDQVHYVPPAIADPNVSPFLLEILQKRCVEDFVQDPRQTRRLCLASGGVLRDLISVTRSAGQNAYLEDFDYVNPSHIDKAVAQLGNSYLLGLGTEQKHILDELLRGGGISPSNPESMELLITRRILERDGSIYEVHPALAEVLQRHSEEAK